MKRRTCATGLTDCLGVSRQVSEKLIHSLLIAQLTGGLPWLECACDFQGRFGKRSDFCSTSSCFYPFCICIWGQPKVARRLPNDPHKAWQSDRSPRLMTRTFLNHPSSPSCPLPSTICETECKYRRRRNTNTNTCDVADWLRYHHPNIPWLRCNSKQFPRVNYPISCFWPLVEAL